MGKCAAGQLPVKVAGCDLGREEPEEDGGGEDSQGDPLPGGFLCALNRLSPDSWSGWGSGQEGRNPPWASIPEKLNLS